MNEALVVGGANGIGLAIAMELAAMPDMRCVHIVDNVDKKWDKPEFKGFLAGKKIHITVG